MGMYDGVSHYYARDGGLLLRSAFLQNGGIMAEFTANALQLVAENQNLLFTETPVCPTRGILHREGSGIVRLRFTLYY